MAEPVDEAPTAGRTSGLATTLKSAFTLLAGGVALLPGGELLLEDVPTAYRVTAGLAMFIAVGTLALCFHGTLLARAPARMGIALLVLGLGLYAGYTGCLKQWTVPGEQEKRIPIGFGLKRWSLTAAGEDKLDTASPKTPYDLMMRGRGYEFGAEHLWRPWTIYAASAVVLAIFLAAVICWAAGWGLIGRVFRPPPAQIAAIRKDAKRGNASRIAYSPAARDAPPSEHDIVPVALLEAVDDLVLRAIVPAEGGGVRHFSARRIRYRSAAPAAMATTPKVNGSLPAQRAQPDDARLKELIGVIRDVLADLRVEDDERQLFATTCARLEARQEHVRAACAYVLAEYLAASAASGAIDEEQTRHVVRLNRALQDLTGWLHGAADRR